MKKNRNDIKRPINFLLFILMVAVLFLYEINFNKPLPPIEPDGYQETLRQPLSQEWFSIPNASALIKQPVVTTLNASTYTTITITASVGNECLPIVAYTEDGTSWYISDTAAGTVNVLVPADVFFSDNCAQFTDGIVFYAKASAGTPNLVVITGRND